MRTSRYIIVSLHVLIWSSLLLLPYFVASAGNQYKIGPVPGPFFTVTGIIHMGIFYGHAGWLYPTFLNRRWWWLYLFLTAVLIIGSFQLKYYLLSAWYPDVLKDPIAYRFVFAPSIVVFVISFIYCKVTDRIRQERDQKEKKTAQLASELKFLRSQISPHFLFNVLTNLVALARKKSDQLEPALIMLSELLRYMIYDARWEKVPLTKELGYLNSYIELQRLRFRSDIEIEYFTAANAAAEAYTIEPMLLIPFVENAFKHGTAGALQPHITIRIAIKDNRLIFEVGNRYAKAAAASADESSGIGLANVQSRLDLLYKNKYTLVVRDDYPVFHVALTMILT
ncbi:sensor histidine kinase [Chitinophaga nivalis]|uniref:Histidine kinase n=1 Tax=Chitinophaga nivalis TaxID=2991709 RepID=A0ABT3IP57_9BACT|nr:histidine kinase [Chitinophaga nivalis]MCW3464549.1 histidine kinase [Chitinophaga nivalis]MCW3485760.1 histidine kinase [Chitinophaga nivalis]